MDNPLLNSLRLFFDRRISSPGANMQEKGFERKGWLEGWIINGENWQKIVDFVDVAVTLNWKIGKENKFIRLVSSYFSRLRSKNDAMEIEFWKILENFLFSILLIMHTSIDSFLFVRKRVTKTCFRRIFNYTSFYLLIIYEGI